MPDKVLTPQEAMRIIDVLTNSDGDKSGYMVIGHQQVGSGWVGERLLSSHEALRAERDEARAQVAALLLALNDAANGLLDPMQRLRAYKTVAQALETPLARAILVQHAATP